MKKQNGITIITLIITVIILLILSGIIVNIAINTNIFDKTNLAINKHSEAELKEKISMAYTESQLNSNYSFENKVKEIFEEIYGKDNITLIKNGQNYKITLNDDPQHAFYVKNDGTVEKYEILDSTNIYAKLDNSGILYLRATEKEGYNLFSNSTSIQSNWNTNGNASPELIKKVIIEEIIVPTNTSSMFSNCQNLKEIQNIKNIHTENSTSMSYMFYNCKSLKSLDLSFFDTSNVTSMSCMFYNCNNLTNVDISNFNTKNVTKMYEMFFGCNNLISLNVSDFNTSKVTDMTRMFNDCRLVDKIDVSNFDISKVKSIDCMFGGCSSIKKIDVSNFDTSNVTNMGYLFYKCNGLTNIDLSNFNTINVSKLNMMFYDCTNLKVLKLSNNFQIDDTDNYSNMFDNVPNNIKITTTEDTKDKIISKSNLADVNFEIIY